MPMLCPRSTVTQLAAATATPTVHSQDEVATKRPEQNTSGSIRLKKKRKKQQQIRNRKIEPFLSAEPIKK